MMRLFKNIKKIIVIFLFTSLIFSTNTDAQIRFFLKKAQSINVNQPILVFIAGQSNAAGSNDNSLYNLIGRPELLNPIPGAYMFQTSTGEFAQLQAGVTNYSTGSGCEIELGYQFYKQTGRQIYFAKLGMSGSPIYNTGTLSDWNINAVGGFYDQFKVIMTNAINKMTELYGSNWEQGPLLWLQGETDSWYPNYTAVYKQNTLDFFAGMRNHVSGLQIINPRVRYAYSQAICGYQREIDTELDYVQGFDTDDCSNDGIHYNVLGQITIASRILNLIL